MKFQKGISIFVLAFLVAGSLVLVLPENGNSQEPVNGCCQYNNVNGEGQDSCVQSESALGCPLPVIGEFIGFFENSDCTPSGVCSGLSPTKAIPTLSEWGLIATAGVLGIIGFIAVRRRKLAA